MPIASFRTLFLAGLLLMALAGFVRAAELPTAFVRALVAADIPLDHVAVVVQPVQAAQPLLSHQVEAAMNPASVMKLVTSFAALAQLGPGYTWTTSVWADGVLADGVLTGDLIIKGYGDPTLTLERMWLLQRALRDRGIRHVQGNIVLDLGHFEIESVDTGAFDDEPLALYNSAPGPLVANFNATVLRLDPVGNVVRVTPDIALPGVTLHSQLVIDERLPCNGWKDAITTTISDPSHMTLVIAGPYPRACGPQTLSLNLFQPAVTFDFIFRALWAESGGSVSGATVPGIAPDSEPLLKFASPPLADALIRLNKHSNNLMARNLLLTLGAEAYGPPATVSKGALAVEAVLKRHAIPTHKLVLENGAGLSRIERINADALARMLMAAYRSPLFSEFESSLPIVAFDGTLKRRFNGSSLYGNAHLKTGSLRDVSSLAGYVVSTSGQRYVFVMLVNHPRARHSVPAQRALLEWVHADSGGLQPLFEQTPLGRAGGWLP